MVGKVDTHCEKNDNYSVMNTLFDGYTFYSQTDTEVVIKLVDY